MLALLLLIPLFAGLVAGTRHGVLAGLAAGAVAAIAELLLLSIASVAARRRDAKQAAARQAAAADAADLETPAAPSTQAAAGTETIDADASKPYVPPPPAARSAELRARRPEDRTRAIDLLPSPLGSRPAWLDGDDGQRLPAYLGAYASYQRLSLDLDPRSTSTAAVYRQLYDGLREACAKHVDLDINQDESQPDIAPIDDLPEHFDAKRRVDDTLFVAFRTRDARWAGFRLGRDSFRLPLERLCGFALNVGIPAKGAGGYEIETIFDRPRRDTEADAQWQWHGSTFQPSLPYADRHSFALLHALSTAAQLFDVRLASSTFSDC
ncbi:hypothetical protein [Burkholderia gladioli]|uniref:hypothetical protein n=1 Tax=Burkholderia gladioli TaxID=28095 RepID=UPI00163E00C3|nr:hypothetical protein [Burkholderia gladioli]